jgi:tripartite ATP-independent transporter DctP family solute receptor
MSNRKKLFSVIALMLTVVLLFVGCAKEQTPPASTNNNNTDNTSKEEVKKVVITWGGNEQLNMATGLANIWAAEQINERSNGTIEVTYHGQGTIGGDQDLIQQVMAGQIQIGSGSIGALSQYTPLLDVSQLPFLISSYEEERAAFESDEWKALVARVEEEFNIKLLCFEENGMRDFATIDKPVNTIEDIKGVKLRVAPSVIIQKAMDLIGANPMSIPYGEVTTALQNGTIDGEEINITSAGSQKHYEVINYISEVGFYPYPGVVMMNGDFYNSLTAEQQKLITEVFAEAQNKIFDELLPESETRLRKECEDNGVVFNKVEDVQPFKDAVQSLYKEYSDKDPLIKAFIDKFN